MLLKLLKVNDLDLIRRNGSWKSFLALVEPIIPNNAYYFRLEQELRETRLMILDLLSNQSNLSSINELRQRVNATMCDMTFEIQREGKIQRMFRL